MPRFKMLRGPEPGKEILLEAEELYIGRGRKNDVIIQDNEVSRNHCRLVQVLDDYEIHDLGSTNGTFVNGQPISAGGWLLSAHAIVELGDSITLEYIPDDLATGTQVPIKPMEAEAGVHYLIVQQETIEQPEIYLLDRNSIAIGRDTDNDIILIEPEVSRHHIRLVLSDRGYAIEDLNTLNGTMVNGKKLQQQQVLVYGDRVRIGTRCRMWYTDDPDTMITQILKGGGFVADNEGDDDTTQSDTRALIESSDSKHTREDIRQVDDDTVDNVGGASVPLPLPSVNTSIFLAHAPDEWDSMVQKLHDYLDDKGFSIWTPQDYDLDSPEWQEAIEKAQLTCHCLLAVVSERSLETTYVKSAMSRFISREKPVVLFQYGDVKRLPMMLERLPQVEYDEKRESQSFRAIVTALRQHC